MQQVTLLLCSPEERKWTSSQSDSDAFTYIVTQVAVALDDVAPLMPALVQELRGRVPLVMRTRWLSVATTAGYLTNAGVIKHHVIALLREDQRGREEIPPAPLLTDARRTQLAGTVLSAMDSTWFQWRAIFLSSLSGQIFRAEEGSPERLRTLLPFLEFDRAFNAFSMHEVLIHIACRLRDMLTDPERWFPAAFEYAAARADEGCGLRGEMVRVMKRAIQGASEYMFGDWRVSSQVAPNLSQWFEAHLLPAALLSQGLDGRVTEVNKKIRIDAAHRLLNDESLVADLNKLDPLGLLTRYKPELEVVAKGGDVSDAFELSLTRFYSCAPTSGHYAEEMVKVGKDPTVVPAQAEQELKNASFCAELRENTSSISEQEYIAAKKLVDAQAERVRAAKKQLSKNLSQSSSS